mmetsp:Transcript_116982/g.218802  ORF Transcript_116982/g.218802 Transcript_116982/m.218802 type:complete len:275 (+) Transcript_116982:860-1684(+)
MLSLKSKMSGRSSSSSELSESLGSFSFAEDFLRAGTGSFLGVHCMTTSMRAALGSSAPSAFASLSDVAPTSCAFSFSSSMLIESSLDFNSSSVSSFASSAASSASPASFSSVSLLSLFEELSLSESESSLWQPMRVTLPSSRLYFSLPVSCGSSFKLTNWGVVDFMRAESVVRRLIFCSFSLSFASSTRSSKLFSISARAASTASISFCDSFISVTCPASTGPPAASFSIISFSFVFSSLSSRINLSCGFSLTTAVFLIFLARSAYRKVESVSS